MIDSPNITPEFMGEEFNSKKILEGLKKSIDTAENEGDKRKLEDLFKNIQEESLSQREISDQLNILASKGIIDLSEERNKLEDLAEKVKLNTDQTGSTKYEKYQELSPKEIKQAADAGRMNSNKGMLGAGNEAKQWYGKIPIVSNIYDFIWNKATLNSKK